MYTDCYGTLIEDIQEYQDIKIGMILKDKHTGKAFRVDVLTRHTTSNGETYIKATEFFTFYSGYTVFLSDLVK